MTSAVVAAIRDTHRHSARWPYSELDVAAVRAGGWSPTPFQEVILKVHQRCNLACDYCYVYTQADQSWRERPAVMSREVWRTAAVSLGRHIDRHGLRSVRVILHGGEPLLLGADRLRQLVTDVRDLLPPGCAVEFGLQTNGVLLDAGMMGELRRLRVSVGVSVDGVSADHDRRRPTRGGRGSFAGVRRALDLLRRPENRDCYAGLLCTVAPETDPVATYNQLMEFEPPLVDFLLPHANWASPPRRVGSPTPYGDWLASVFDHWCDSGTETRIRLFEDVISLSLGGAGQSEQLGLSPAAMLVIESDGSIEQVDSLKSTYAGACATGLDIRHDELDALFDDPGVVARQLGRGALAPACLTCPVQRVCGGGHYVHRYRPGDGFRNRSVYCEDMRRLIDHVRGRVTTRLSHLGAAKA